MTQQRLGVSSIFDGTSVLSSKHNNKDVSPDNFYIRNFYIQEAS